MGKMDLLERLSLVFEAEEGGCVADFAEEEEGCHGGDQEHHRDDLVEVLGEPCGKIKALGFGEAAGVECGQCSDLGVFGGLGGCTVLDQH